MVFPAMSPRPLTVVWISFFPIEWLDGITEELRTLPKLHPASWQRVLLGELEHREDLRLHIFVLRKQFARSEIFERNGVVFHLIKTLGGLRAPSFYWLDTFLIRRELARVEPDVVHAWGTEGGAALVAGRLGYPYLVTCQGLLNWIGENIPLNGYDRFHAYLEDIALRGASTVTAESSFAVRYLKQRHPHLDIHQVEHSPLAIFFELVRKPQMQPKRFLFVGTFSFLKGGDVLMKALDALVPEMDFELVCIGSTDKVFVDSLRASTSDSLWRRVRFTGSKTAPEIVEELSRATLVIYPTRCDNSPNAVKEAVVAGVPVIASRIGGIVDYVWPSRNGLLFEAGDVEGCRQSIWDACVHPMFGCGTVDGDALREARHYLSVSTMAARFRALYASVANGGRAANATAVLR